MSGPTSSLFPATGWQRPNLRRLNIALNAKVLYYPHPSGLWPRLSVRDEDDHEHQNSREFRGIPLQAFIGAAKVERWFSEDLSENKTVATVEMGATGGLPASETALSRWAIYLAASFPAAQRHWRTSRQWHTHYLFRTIQNPSFFKPRT